ncbi:hypothetical protein ACFRCQ_09305 [Cytobacillus firmus]|uniref:hypothetical protein n=1 Tax=Cytobacillus firmus TaxID=1399 RepID=UPI00367F0C57
MKQRKWTPIKEMDGSNTLVWGDKSEVLPGVQSGKCGFTTLSPFPRLFPQF